VRDGGATVVQCLYRAYVTVIRACISSLGRGMHSTECHSNQMCICVYVSHFISIARQHAYAYIARYCFTNSVRLSSNADTVKSTNFFHYLEGYHSSLRQCIRFLNSNGKVVLYHRCI